MSLASAAQPLEIVEPGVVAAGRYHAFDALRAFAMLLGVFFHASLAYIPTPQPFWIVQDGSHSLVLGAFAWTSHSFRMPVFFAMSGFFARLLCERRGAEGFARQRAVRIALPFAVGVVLDNLIQHGSLSWLYAAGWFTPHAPDLAAIAADPLDAASYVHDFKLGVYWFLEYLAVFSLGAWACALRGIGSAGAASRLERAWSRLLRGRARCFALALPHAALLAPTQLWGVGSPSGLLPEPVWLGYHGLFFAFGWWLHRRRTDLETWLRPWQSELVAALPVGALALAGALGGSSGALPAWTRGGVLWLTSSFTWLMVLGLTGLFMRAFVHARHWIRYVSDASYWFYLTHDYWVQGMQIALFPLALSAAAKYALVLVSTFLILFSSYAFAVRYTALGVVLHGRRRRPG